MTKISLKVTIHLSTNNKDKSSVILAQVDGQTIARRKLTGILSQAQAERQWRLYAHHFSFVQDGHVVGVRKLLGV